MALEPFEGRLSCCNCANLRESLLPHFSLLVKCCSSVFHISDSQHHVKFQFVKMVAAGSKYCNNVYALLAILLLLVETGHSIRCYQCNSTSNAYPFQCNEVLSSDVDLQPEACDVVYGAQYCVKHTGRFEGGIGTKRFCSAVDMGNYCDYVKQPGDKLTYRTCVFTCSGDGCNLATSIMSTKNLWILPVGFLITWGRLFHR